MKIATSFFSIAALFAAANLVSGAVISGKIVLKGDKPSETAIPLDPQCSKLHAQPLTTRFYEVSKDGGLADTVIYLKEGVAKKSYPIPSEPKVMDQVGCEYVPYVLAGRAGQTIRVKNSDPLLHNVHPTPAVAGNREYNKAQLPKGPDLTFSWENPEMFLRFKCDVHPWMFSYISLFEHPFFAVSDKDGNFTIKDVPPGEYTIEAIHRKAGTASQKITVGGDTQKVNFDLEAPKK